MADIGTSWRLRNNSIHTNTDFKIKKKIFRPSCSKDLRQTLYSNVVGSDHTKSMIDTLRTESFAIDKTPKLVKGMTHLKQMHLLVSKELRKVRYIERNNKGI